MSVWCMLKKCCTVTMVGLDGGLHSMSVWCMLKKCCTVTMVGLDGDLHSMSFLWLLVSDTIITSDKGGGKCVCPHSFVCLSVCLLARLLKNACMDLDEMLRVNRCRDMDELINFRS